VHVRYVVGSTHRMYTVAPSDLLLRVTYHWSHLR